MFQVSSKVTFSQFCIIIIPTFVLLWWLLFFWRDSKFMNTESLIEITKIISSPHLSFFFVVADFRSLSFVRIGALRAIYRWHCLRFFVDTISFCCHKQSLTIGAHRVRTYAYFYWRTHDFRHAYINTYSHFYSLVCLKLSEIFWFL